MQTRFWPRPRPPPSNAARSSCPGVCHSGASIFTAWRRRACSSSPGFSSRRGPSLRRDGGQSISGGRSPAYFRRSGASCSSSSVGWSVRRDRAGTGRRGAAPSVVDAAARIRRLPGQGYVIPRARQERGHPRGPGAGCDRLAQSQVLGGRRCVIRRDGAVRRVRRFACRDRPRQRRCDRRRLHDGALARARLHGRRLHRPEQLLQSELPHGAGRPVAEVLGVHVRRASGWHPEAVREDRPGHAARNGAAKHIARRPFLFASLPSAADG